MSYCNQPASLALREVGFDEPTSSFYTKGKDELRHEIIPFDHNMYEFETSAPDHLQAADWLLEKHGIEIAFLHGITFVFCEDKDIWGKKDKFTQSDHRDRAIIAACEIIKERRKICSPDK